MRKFLYTLAALAACGALAGQAQAGPNLLTNPGFETGDFTGWTRSGNLGFTSVQTFAAHSGSFGAFVGPIGSLGFLSQTLTTTPGTYDISFWLESDGGTPNEFQVSFNGSVVFDMVNIPAMPYTEFFATGVATGASTDFTVGFRNDPGFLEFDDLSVSSSNVVPEPATWVLVCVGAVGIVPLLRRKRALVA